MLLDSSQAAKRTLRVPSAALDRAPCLNISAGLSDAHLYVLQKQAVLAALEQRPGAASLKHVRSCSPWCQLCVAWCLEQRSAVLKLTAHEGVCLIHSKRLLRPTLRAFCQQHIDLEHKSSKLDNKMLSCRTCYHIWCGTKATLHPGAPRSQAALAAWTPQPLCRLQKQRLRATRVLAGAETRAATAARQSSASFLSSKSSGAARCGSFADSKLLLSVYHCHQKWETMRAATAARLSSGSISGLEEWRCQVLRA